jgi:hypothetical protein
MNIIGSLLFTGLVIVSAIVSGVITCAARMMLFGAKMSDADAKILMIIFASVFALNLVTMSPINLITGKRKEKEDGF